MNVELLRTFLEIVETGSLVKAAARLNVTQSTVTARINTLEADVGQRLIHRSKSGAALTSPGFKFQRYAEAIVQLWRQAKYETSLPKNFVGVCNLGYDLDLWKAAGEFLLDDLRLSHPDIAVSAWPGEQDQLDRWLTTGLIDVALCYAPQARDPFLAHEFLEDAMILVSTTKRPYRDWDPEYIYVDHGDEFRRQHATVYPVTETAAVTIGSSSWALDFMLKQGGSGYLPLRHVQELLKRKTLHRVEKAPIFRRSAYIIENTATTRHWPWFNETVSRLKARVGGTEQG
jgi:DNA-binding transcriptional LysR family regulator